MSVAFVPSTCSYCGTGCGVLYQTDGTKILAALPNPVSPVNRGKLCIKGWSLHQHVHAPGRLTVPLLRVESELVPAEWDEALSLAAQGIKETVDRYGPDSVMLLASARITNEENYLAQKFMRAVIGSNNVDHCARLCHSASVSGLAATLGSGAMTNSLDDLENSARCVFVIGSNTSECHPLVAARMMRAKARGARILVADPRPTQMAGMADMAVQPKPGTDVTFLNAVAGVIVREGLYEPAVENSTEDFPAFKNHVAAVTPEEASERTGIPAKDIARFARLYAGNSPAAICYAMGITQYTNGTERVQACSNLALLAGNIGVPGGGVNPLRGQNNVQGACDMGCLPDVLPGYRPVGEASAREAAARVWGRPVPEKPGLLLTRLPEAILQGKIRVLYVIGENPLLSDPDVGHLREAFARLQLLVVQDIFLTDTAKLAHVVLPAAAAPEKDGTFTNTERRCLRLNKAVPPPGKALNDAEILCRLAGRLGYSRRYDSAEAIFDEMRKLTPSYAGMTYARLGIRGLQWPCPTEGHPGTPVLHMGGCARGKGKFMVLDDFTPAESPDEEYPFILSTGRNFAHYHTATMSGVSETLAREGGEAYVEMHPEDAAAIHAEDGRLLRLTTRRGSITVSLRIREGMKKGTVFIPFHYRESPANLLTQNSVDPLCGIPEYKHCAVRVEHA
ncbi:MAG: formate dehydrogenase subunit alpha [Desulfovibrio sp.]|jgi:formate dehydrogenase alpha subunit|nr:formate dehydrogenase subunit alpha [Desulfovibrio sp.]